MQFLIDRNTELTTDEARENMSKANTGREITWKEKISKSHTGMKYDKSFGDSVSKALIGRKLSEEHKQAIKDGWARRKQRKEIDIND